MSSIPQEYHGREQSWLKHRVLEEYLEAWSHKLGGGKGQGEAHLWYVDVFAGPWKSARQDLADTSIFIGLKELCKAAETWKGRGRTVRLHAIFVEKERGPFTELKAFTAAPEWSAVDIRCIHGEFGAQVDEVGRLIGDQPALIFVDPTGWKGAALRFIAPLARRPMRDVLVNVMYDHLNRFKDDERPWLREQFDEFFGLEGQPLPFGMNEAELMKQYRDQLKRRGELRFVADLAIPMPHANRTKFRLVVGGHSPKVLEVFRDVEAKVIGQDAAKVKEDHRQRTDPQVGLFSQVTMLAEPNYAKAKHQGLDTVRSQFLAALANGERIEFRNLWPPLLETHHLRFQDIKDLVADLRRQGLVVIEGMGPRERAVKDDHLIRIGKK